MRLDEQGATIRPTPVSTRSAQVDDRITRLTLRAVSRRFPEGGSYVGQLVEFIQGLEARGLTATSAAEVSQATRRFAAEQVRYLLAHDTAERYYSQAFHRLGLGPDVESVDPAILLEHLAYSPRDLVGGAAQRLRLASAPLRGGRVYYSSGTTDPARRKRIYYDEVTSVLIRSLAHLGWEASERRPMDSSTCLLMLVPSAAKLSMPMASVVADTAASAGVHVYWAARFVRPPCVRTDDVFGVPAAQLDFKDNVRPDRRAVAQFNLTSRVLGGAHRIVGLLPSVHAMLRSTETGRGVVRFLARPRPRVLSVGGGLKHMGIPPEVRAAGGAALAAYLSQVAEVTGVGRAELAAMAADARAEGALDEVLTVFLIHEVERMTGAPCFNVFAGAELMPPLFPVGTLRELYGDGWARIGSGGRAANVLVPVPGIAIELRDPLSDEVIPRHQLDRPGLLRFWNPFNVSHLQVIESEDLFAWVRIPPGAPWQPAYAEGTGLRFAGRAMSGGAGGYCA